MGLGGLGMLERGWRKGLGRRKRSLRGVVVVEGEEEGMMMWRERERRIQKENHGIEESLS
jgi:hypothetical protein